MKNLKVKSSRIICILIITVIFNISLSINSVYSSEPEQGDYSGKTEFITGQSINGALIGGALLLGLTGDEDALSSMTPFAGVFAGAGIGLHSSYILADKQPYVTRGQAYFVHSVSLWSAFEGLMLGIIVSPKTEKPFILSSIFNAAGTMAACHLAYPEPPHKNKVAMVDAAGLWGAALGLGSFFLFSDRYHSDDLATFVFVGSAAGMVSTGFWGMNDEFSPPQVAKISGIGLLGGLIGTSIMTLPLICDVRSKYWDELLLTGAIIGSVSGLIYGFNKYKDDRAGKDGEDTQNRGLKSEQIIYFNIPVGGSW